MRLSDENLRGRTVIAADGQAIGELLLYSVTATHGGSSRCRSSYATKSLTNSVRRAACFTLEHLRCLSAWFSLSATPWSSRWPHMSYGRFCRVSATLRLHMKDSACSWGAYAALQPSLGPQAIWQHYPGRSPQEQYRAENAQPRAAPRTLATLNRSRTRKEVSLFFPCSCQRARQLPSAVCCAEGFPDSVKVSPETGTG